VSGIRELDAAVPAAEEWITDLMARLGWRDREKVYRALIVFMHALRDCLPSDEVVYLGEHLPALLRGLYYEGWHPTRHAAPFKSRSDFFERIHEGMHRDLGIDPEQVVHTVFALLAARLPSAELEDLKAVTPSALCNLWPS